MQRTEHLCTAVIPCQPDRDMTGWKLSLNRSFLHIDTHTHTHTRTRTHTGSSLSAWLFTLHIPIKHAHYILRLNKTWRSCSCRWKEEKLKTAHVLTGFTWYTAHTWIWAYQLYYHSNIYWGLLMQGMCHQHGNQSVFWWKSTLQKKIRKEKDSHRSGHVCICNYNL